MRCISQVVLVGVMLASTSCADAGDDSVGEDTPIDNDESPTDDEPANGPDFEVRYRTKYVDIAPGFTQPVCRGTLDEIDRYMEVVAESLDIDIQNRTTVFWYSSAAEGSFADTSEICDWCSSTCAGCYKKDAVHVRAMSLHHELVHAVVTPAWGRSDKLFEEGIAIGWDRMTGTHGSGVTSIYNLPDKEKPSDIAGSGKHGGARFSPWLVDRSGPEKFRQLFARLDYSLNKAQIFTVVEEVYGVSFEDLEAEYFAVAPTAHPLPALCEGHVHIPWNDERWELSGPADCDAPYMFGPDDEGGMTAVAIIDIPPEYVDVPIAPWIPSDVNATIWPCIEESFYDPDDTLLAINGISNWSVPMAFRMAGRYRIELPVRDASEVYLRLCPDNGKSPWDYPLDKTIDPGNCPGD